VVAFFRTSSVLDIYKPNLTTDQAPGKKRKRDGEPYTFNYAYTTPQNHREMRKKTSTQNSVHNHTLLGGVNPACPDIGRDKCFTVIKAVFDTVQMERRSWEQHTQRELATQNLATNACFGKVIAYQDNRLVRARQAESLQNVWTFNEIAPRGGRSRARGIISLCCPPKSSFRSPCC
jgi:hypothetical protein